MLDMPGFDIGIALDCFVRLAIAFALALPVALEREKEDKPLGLRTFPLSHDVGQEVDKIGNAVTDAVDDALDD